MPRHVRSFLASLAVLAGCVDAPEPEAPAPALEPAPQTTGDHKLRAIDGAIDGEYLIVLAGASHRLATGATIDRLATRHGATIRRRYGAALHGFSARMTEADARALAADPAVAFVEPNTRMHATAVQTNATWGLDRVDQRNLPLDGKYNHTGDGAGATVYVVDSGINTSHSEFTGRLLPGAYTIEDGNETEDCNGHGTHVAGTVAGTLFGVAKLAQIEPIRVLDCEGSGPTDGIIAALDFIVQNHPPGSVANMSLGGPASAALDMAIRSLVQSGVTVVVAAGNETQNACNVSPAREPLAITVGATTMADTRSDFSNFGSCVDVMAPGSDITSAWIGGASATDTINGTSMASPHVAGAAALFVGQNPSATPAQVTAALLAAATPNKLTGLNGSPNLLLHTSFATAPSGPEVAITSPANGATVQPSFPVTVGVDSPLDLIRAELAIDGATVEVLTSGTIAFQVTNLAAGPHVLEVRVTDADNQIGRATVSITVGGGGFGGGNNPPPPPPMGGEDEGGCSTSGGSGGLVLALLALAAARRRRRG